MTCFHKKNALHTITSGGYHTPRHRKWQARALSQKARGAKVPAAPAGPAAPTASLNKRSVVPTLTHPALWGY